ncbi:MAG: hypothetical protein LKF01_05625 [Lactobacillus sp.]|jgi:hypothetical protein|nr:hypothetical protein [Lactobacillus sp.]MCH3906092.1 hypothetical protein [Lactobacillus sp.]MCH3990333.1 hypothetical protein [Lactobacillus sp.]MCH4068952.1 hypothetical protein [Lactobacillus sp.]MCI1303354.1 hypothetical protein [Lactobacillus sp.]
MYKATTRKVGNSIMISIPKELHPVNNQEYLFYKTKAGDIIMTPKIKNPFTNDQKFVDASDNTDFEFKSMKEMPKDIVR